MNGESRGGGHWLIRPWRLMFDFAGRSPRREYWLFMLQCYALVLGAALGVGFSSEWLDPKRGNGLALVILGFLAFFLILLIPTLAAMVRRLHDSGKPGVLVLLLLVPAIGGLIIFFLMLLPGDEGENVYGPDPREPDWSPRDAQDIFG